jgi:hypothetical protein
VSAGSVGVGCGVGEVPAVVGGGGAGDVVLAGGVGVCCGAEEDLDGAGDAGAGDTRPAAASASPIRIVAMRWLLDVFAILGPFPLTTCPSGTGLA